MLQMPHQMTPSEELARVTEAIGRQSEIRSELEAEIAEIEWEGYRWGDHSPGSTSRPWFGGRERAARSELSACRSEIDRLDSARSRLMEVSRL